MIKTPAKAVFSNILYKWCVYDAVDRIIASFEKQEEAAQIVEALNAQTKAQKDGGEFVASLRNTAGRYKVGLKDETTLLAQAEQAAERIEELEKAFRRFYQIIADYGQVSFPENAVWEPDQEYKELVLADVRDVLGLSGPEEAP